MIRESESRVRFAGLAATAAIIWLAIVTIANAAVLAKPSPALSASVALERSVILNGSRRPVYVLIHFASPEIDLPAARRPPLNLSLVLDRSGSMADKGKIEYLKQAAKMAVANLGERDVVSVVEFDDRITLMWPASHVHDVARLQSEIDELAPRGSTNLAGGLTRGIDEAEAARERLHLADDMVSRVVLLTDGLANTGITDHGEIAAIASHARDQGLRVSTIGLGLDYDEDLLQAIAEGGGGKYYYVESPVQLADIFENELKSAFATSARDVRLAFHGSAAVRSAALIGFSQESGSDVAAGWPDFYAGENRTVLLRLEIDAHARGELALGHFAVAWRDAQSGASGTIDLPIRVTVSGDRAASERSIDRDVAVEATLSESEQALAKSVRLAQSGQVEEARKANAANIDELKARNALLKDSRIARKLEAMSVEENVMSTAAAAPAPEAMQNYVKASKQRLYQAKLGQRGGYLLQKGDKGLDVERLQQALAKEGFYTGKATGVFDEPTVAAVRAYQKKTGENADGVAGAATQARLGLY